MSPWGVFSGAVATVQVSSHLGKNLTLVWEIIHHNSQFNRSSYSKFIHEQKISLFKQTTF